MRVAGSVTLTLEKLSKQLWPAASSKALADGK